MWILSAPRWTCVLVLFTVAVFPATAQSRKRVERPGLERGATLLPNGWRIAPAGRHMNIGDLPLAMAQSPDGRYLVVSNNGFNKPTLVCVDLDHQVVSSRLTLDEAWLGLAWSPAGNRLYSSGAAARTVQEILFEKGKLKAGRTIPLAQPDKEKNTLTGGLALSADGKSLYVVEFFGNLLHAVDVVSATVTKTVSLPAEPYTCLLSGDGASLFVSLWGGASVLIFDARTLAAAGEISVGEHPNAMALSKDGKRLFVACANTNAVWVADVASRKAREQISIALYPHAPPGSTPNGLGLSPDGGPFLSPTPTTTTLRSFASRTRRRVVSRDSSRRAGIRPPCCSRRMPGISHSFGEGAHFPAEPARAAAGDPRSSGAADARHPAGLLVDRAGPR